VTRVPILIVIGLVAPLLFAGTAHAYHNADFATPVLVGGGNGIYFTGSPRYKGYDCSVCHALAAEQITVELNSEPPELFAEGRWTPGQTYFIRATMLGEHLGNANAGNGYDHNSLVAEVIDDFGGLVGEWDGDDPNSVFTMDVAGGDSRVVAAYSDDGGTVWNLRFTAPAAGAGRLSLHLGAVDGNAAGGAIATVVDPFGDDVFVGAWRFCEAGVGCETSLPTITEDEVDHSRNSPAAHGCSASGVGDAAGWFVVVVVLAFLRRRRLEGLTLCTMVLALACDDFQGPGDVCPNGICEYGDPAEVTGTSPELDEGYFACEAQPVLQARCSLYACHGTEERPFVVYSPTRLRLEGEGEGETVLPTTALERLANYESAVAFARDDVPETSMLLLKGLDVRVGGYYHFGESLYYQSDVFESTADVGYQKLLAWIEGETRSVDCAPTSEVGP